MIISVNAKIVEAFKKSLVNLPKNDWIDAFTIAETETEIRQSADFIAEDTYLNALAISISYVILFKQLTSSENIFLSSHNTMLVNSKRLKLANSSLFLY